VVLLYSAYRIVCVRESWFIAYRSVAREHDRKIADGIEFLDLMHSVRQSIREINTACPFTMAIAPLAAMMAVNLGTGRHRM